MTQIQQGMPDRNYIGQDVLISEEIDDDTEMFYDLDNDVYRELFDSDDE